MTLLERNINKLASIKEKYIDQLPEESVEFKSAKIILQKSLRVFENSIEPALNGSSWELGARVE